MTENIDYGDAGDAELSGLIEGDNNYSYDKDFSNAGYSEVTPDDEDGTEDGMSDDIGMDFGFDDDGLDDYEE